MRTDCNLQWPSQRVLPTQKQLPCVSPFRPPPPSPPSKVILPSWVREMQLPRYALIAYDLTRCPVCQAAFPGTDSSSPQDAGDHVAFLLPSSFSPPFSHVWQLYIPDATSAGCRASGKWKCITFSSDSLGSPGIWLSSGTFWAYGPPPSGQWGVRPWAQRGPSPGQIQFCPQ